MSIGVKWSADDHSMRTVWQYNGSISHSIDHCPLLTFVRQQQQQQQAHSIFIKCSHVNNGKSGKSGESGSSGQQSDWVQRKQCVRCARVGPMLHIQFYSLPCVVVIIICVPCGRYRMTLVCCNVYAFIQTTDHTFVTLTHWLMTHKPTDKQHLISKW